MDLIFVDESTQVSSRDRGLLYGDGFFTTALINKKNILFSEEHFKRLSDSAQRLGFKDFSVDVLKSNLPDLPDYGILKITVTRGVGERGYAAPDDENCTCLIDLVATAQPNFETEFSPIAVAVCKTPISKNRILAGIKHLNKLEHVLARNEVKRFGADEGLMLCDDTVICATQGNVFLCQAGEVFTPTLNEAGVNGIMKMQVVEWLNDYKISVTERDIKADEINQFDEMFITNCVKGVQGVERIVANDQSLITRFSSHALTQQLQQKFLSVL